MNYSREILRNDLKAKSQIARSFARAIARATQAGEPYAVIRTRAGAFKAVSMMRVPSAVPLLFMTVTPAEWNARSGL